MVLNTQITIALLVGVNCNLDFIGHPVGLVELTLNLHSLGPGCSCATFFLLKCYFSPRPGMTKREVCACAAGDQAMPFKLCCSNWNPVKIDYINKASS